MITAAMYRHPSPAPVFTLQGFEQVTGLNRSWGTFRI